MKTVTRASAENEVGMTHSSDELLVRRLKLRDKTALSDLLDRHGSMMHSVALRLMRNEERAQEVVQDTLIAVWNKAQSYRGESKLGTWLYRITTNAALMQLRKQRGLRHFVSLDEFENPDAIVRDAQGERPDATMLRNELGVHLQQAIDALPEPNRTTLVLSDLEGLSIASVARLTQVSEAAVKSRLHRARLILRKELLPYLEDRPRFEETAAALTELCAA